MQTSEVILEAQQPESAPVPAKRFVLPASLQLFAGFAAIFFVMWWIEFGGNAILDNDGFYHMRWSRTLRENFPHLPKFPALPLTSLNETDYVDHHYLFHVALMPFTFGADMRLGAKWAAVTFSSLGILSIFALLVGFEVRYKWLWLPVIIASSEPFLYRMAMTRAPALSLGLLGLGTFLILRRKYLWLVPLSFAFVWYYSLFPLILILALIYSLTVFLAEQRIEWRAPLASLTGIIAGLIINPYFPKNFRLLYEHILMKATAGSGYSVDVGVEWYPYETWTMVSLSAVAFVVYIAGLLAFEYRRRQIDSKPLFFLFVSLLLLLMAFKSRRFVEYWPPFAVVFAAFTITPRIARYDRSWLSGPSGLSGARVTEATVQWIRRIAGLFGESRERYEASLYDFAAAVVRRRGIVVAAIAAAVTTVILAEALAITVFQARADIKSEPNAYEYQGASAWIASHVPPGAMVFNTDWDDFPMLYYYNPNNTYIVGLDPTYLYDRHPDLWKLYARITLGDQDDPAPLIRDRFGAEWVFTDNQHTDFLDNANESGKFEIVYSDAKTTVLRLKSAAEIKQAETPPEDSSDDDDDSDQ
jgi:hypothetical protein